MRKIYVGTYSRPGLFFTLPYWYGIMVASYRTEQKLHKKTKDLCLMRVFSFPLISFLQRLISISPLPPSFWPPIYGVSRLWQRSSDSVGQIEIRNGGKEIAVFVRCYQKCNVKVHPAFFTIPVSIDLVADNHATVHERWTTFQYVRLSVHPLQTASEQDIEDLRSNFG